ncbi:helix-turn-helix transcriptional regulator [Haloplasma contractile]|uniref:Transcriptional regulator DeoR family protein n=1 Tax=Haloplasma contractile SSD-17B TaxID=1033810 RepID=F7Q120_9MOLU|nr:YafY family protein [Haloplasma contractile]ERJ11337.1 Transcriptional regulator DeoR family protein [Haloplasma contractile SSD-17B]
MKIDRIINMITILIKKQKVTSKELAEYFGVSVRTIQRDIDTLSMAGIPIYSEVGKKGGYKILEAYTFDKNFLNIDEANILIPFLKNLQQSVPSAELDSVFNKFSSLSKHNNDQKLVVKMNPLINEKSFKHILSQLTKARDEQLKITITYIDSEFEKTMRTINPYTLVMLGTTWYVYAFCKLRNDFRMFKLTRIVTCELLTEKFIVKDKPEPLPWDHLLDSGRDSTEIILEIDRALQGKLPEYFDFNNCKIKDNKIIVNLFYPVDEWLYSLLTGLIPHVKIIKPDWLRAEFINRLELSLEKNKL